MVKSDLSFTEGLAKYNEKFYLEVLSVIHQFLNHDKNQKRYDMLHIMCNNNVPRGGLASILKMITPV